MLRVLMIGGGRQIGRAIADRLDASMIELTILNRGITSQLGEEFYREKNIQYIRNERKVFINSNDLNFDVVIDTCSYDPIAYSEESIIWKNFHGKYILISSAYVYDYNSCFIDESSGLISEKKIPIGQELDSYQYGIKKIQCERIASESLSDLLIIRPGILLSEYDHTLRLEKWITRVESGFYPSEAQKRWITQMLSLEDFINFIFKCINSKIKGVVNTAGTPLPLEQFWSLIVDFTEVGKIKNKFIPSRELEFFEKQSQSIIKSDRAEKIGLTKTNSKKLLTQILKKKCKKY